MNKRVPHLIQWPILYVELEVPTTRPHILSTMRNPSLRVEEQPLGDNKFVALAWVVVFRTWFGAAKLLLRSITLEFLLHCKHF
jgi:hypothetical protein